MGSRGYFFTLILGDRCYIQKGNASPGSRCLEEVETESVRVWVHPSNPGRPGQGASPEQWDSRVRG